jgi:hypothetical protein
MRGERHLEIIATWYPIRGIFHKMFEKNTETRASQWDSPVSLGSIVGKIYSVRYPWGLS